MAQTINLLTTANIVAPATSARASDVAGAQATKAALTTLEKTIPSIVSKGDGVWEIVPGSNG